MRTYNILVDYLLVIIEKKIIRTHRVFVNNIGM